MSHADTARDAVRETLKKAYSPVHAAGKDYAAAYQQAISKTDLVEAMAHAIDLVLAAEHLHELAGEAVKTARAELAKQMQEVGCYNLHSGSVSAHLARKPTVLSIDAPKDIPAEYLIQPPPVPDRKRIRDAIETGAEVKGASLVIPNEMSLVIRSKSK
jgi:hypothetical protein